MTLDPRTDLVTVRISLTMTSSWTRLGRVAAYRPQLTSRTSVLISRTPGQLPLILRDLSMALERARRDGTFPPVLQDVDAAPPVTYTAGRNSCRR